MISDPFIFIWFAGIVAFCLGYFIKGLVEAKKRGELDRVFCDACGYEISADQTNVGHDCDLHEWCAEWHKCPADKAKS